VTVVDNFDPYYDPAVKRENVVSHLQPPVRPVLHRPALLYRTCRDYTYVADIVRGIRAAMAYNDESYAVMNVGSGELIELNDMIYTLERVLGQPLKRNHRPEQPGDVPRTWADISRAGELIDYEPRVDFEDGGGRFVDSLNLTEVARAS